MLVRFADVLLMDQKRYEALGDLPSVVRVLRMEAHVEQVIEGTVGCDDPDISYAHAFVNVGLWEANIGRRSVQRKAVFLLEKLTFVDNVGGWALFVGVVKGQSWDA